MIFALENINFSQVLS